MWQCGCVAFGDRVFVYVSRTARSGVVRGCLFELSRLRLEWGFGVDEVYSHYKKFYADRGSAS